MTTPSQSAVMSAVVVAQAQIPSNTTPMRIAFFDEEGVPVVGIDETPTGDNVPLTDYESGSADDIADTDTVNEAFAKVEARLEDLEDNTANDYLMTGYVEGEADPISATDTILEAIAKLEARLVVVEDV